MRQPILSGTCCTAAIAFAISALVGCGDNQTHVDRPSYVSPDATPLSCIPNLDGQIDPAELQPALDVPASYLVNPAGTPRAVDVVGTLVAGRKNWSFGIDFADDAKVTITATALTGKWYQASFPTGQFVTPFDLGGAIEQIYRKDDSGLFLLGLASSKPDAPEGKTLLVYDQAIPVIKLPLVPGSSWVAAGSVTGATLRGLPYAGKDTYEVEDVELGQLVLHDYTFQQVHRLRTKVTVAPAAGASNVQRQVSFVAECFGEVTRATSATGETNPDFGTATELRRLGQ